MQVRELTFCDLKITKIKDIHFVKVAFLTIILCVSLVSLFVLNSLPNLYVIDQMLITFTEAIVTFNCTKIGEYARLVPRELIFCSRVVVHRSLTLNIVLHGTEENDNEKPNTKKNNNRFKSVLSTRERVMV